MLKIVPSETKTTETKQFHTELLKVSGLTHKTEPQRSIHTQRNLIMSRNFRKILKLVFGLTLVGLGSFGLKPNAALAGGGFANSCDSLRLYKNSPGWLYGHCRRANGTWNEQARIDLRNLLTNNNGTLGWQPNGGFLGSCNWDTDAKATSGLFPTGLNQQFPVFIGFHAPCKNIAGATNITPDINLNDRILNQNGDLQYGGQ